LTAKIFFNKNGIVLLVHFDSVWWLGYDWAFSRYPKMFLSFIIKQVSGWCSCNSMLLLWEENIINTSPQCGCKYENLKHLIRCRDPGCLLQLHNSIKTIMDVLNDAKVPSELPDMIEVYLLNQT
jgi:hypothetical protein